MFGNIGHVFNRLFLKTNLQFVLIRQASSENLKAKKKKKKQKTGCTTAIGGDGRSLNTKPKKFKTQRAESLRRKSAGSSVQLGHRELTVTLKEEQVEADGG